VNLRKTSARAGSSAKRGDDVLSWAARPRTRLVRKDDYLAVADLINPGVHRRPPVLSPSGPAIFAIV